MDDIAISVRNISKCYKVFDNKLSRLQHTINPNYQTNIREVWALKDINFEIKRGDKVAIIGKNGGGKSTLLEIITGTLKPTSGDVTIKGRISALLELGSGFNPEYTGRDNVMLNGLLLGLSRKEILSRFDEIEAFAEIGLAIDRKVKTYSSGMTMRLAFAVQVLCDPDILIIDEALSVGDFFFQQKCLGYIRKLCDKGTTLLFVSHDMGTVRDICNHGLLLSSGQLHFFGEKSEAIHRYLSNEPTSNIVNSPPTYPALIENAENAIWCTRASTSLKEAQILSVNLLDSNGHPNTSFSIGSDITIQVLFQSCSIKPVHVGVVFKNKYDQILTSVSSYTLKTEMPAHLNDKNTVLFKLQLKLAVESGSYTFSAKLGHTGEIGQPPIFLDETPWLGPILVTWNYQEGIPPFFGMVGLPASAQFLTNID